MKLPNGSTIQASHTALLNLPQLPIEARRAHIFPDLNNSALVSIGQFCDNQCEAIFNKRQVKIINQHNEIVLTGPRDPITGLWTIDLNPTPQSANSVYEQRKQQDIVKYLHQACGSPVPSTWIKAIKAGFFATWPGLTENLVKKHLPKSIATAKGHLKQEQQGIRSTQPKAAIPQDCTSSTKPVMTTDSSEVRTNWAFMLVIQFTGQIFSDQTGRFPITSSRGNKYVMIVYDYDSNAIIAEPMKSRTASELLRAYKKLHIFLTDRGLKPVLQRLDNEAPGNLKKFMHDKQINFQLVPPHLHRRNAAERAIGIWKEHFIATLSTTDPQFPMHLWCRLIDQATTTLNLLRPSRINPRLSAEAQLNGAFDYNATPFAPPGSRILVHEKVDKRRTWAPHGVEGWYLGRAPEHYRCHRVYISKTASERIADTVEFFPSQCKMPQNSSTDAATAAATALTNALVNPSPSTPFANIGNEQMDALQQLAKIFASSTSNDAKSPRVPISKNLATSNNKTPPSPRVAEPTPNPSHRYPLRSQQSANSAIFPPIQQANSVTDPITGQVQEYRHLMQGPEKVTWVNAFANELGRLCQGVGKRMPTGSETCFFIPKSAVPVGRKVTYGRIVAQIRPQKEETHRCRLTVGGDRLEYEGNVSAPTAKLTTAKCLLNSVISDPHGRFLVADIKNFYLNSLMIIFEYMRLPIKIIPTEIVEQYKLQNVVTPDGWVYLEIRKGMYGLKQAGILANEQLTKHLALSGYHPTPRTPGLWAHKTRNIKFSLVVDDFGIKYNKKADAEHLLQTLRNKYQISVDWTGQLYCGLSIAWNYEQRHVDISMPGYVDNALHKFSHPEPEQPEDAPHAWNRPTYGAKIQYAETPSTADTLTQPAITRIQQVIGTLLYYSIAVDPTMLVALGTIASTQASATKETAKAVVQLLNYAATHRDATIRYVASGMVLYIHSDGSYLSAPKARSRAGGHMFLSDTPINPNKPPASRPTLNGPLHSTCHILRNVMASAAEAEVGALFYNGQEAVPIRTTLEELGHPQPPTPMQTDNSTAAGFANGTIKQKRSKAMDMRFYWIKDRVRQGHYLVYWRPGSENLGDYHTKHHGPSHHQKMRPVYLHIPKKTPHDQRTSRVCQFPQSRAHRAITTH